MSSIGYCLVGHLRRQIAWSKKTFGPHKKTAGIIAHLRSELVEIEETPNCLEEWMDVALLAFDGAWRQGYTPEEITSALRAKLEKNILRKWPDWRSADPDLPVEHIEEDPPAYVMLNGSCLRKVGNSYYRDAGAWGFEFIMIDGVVRAKHPSQFPGLVVTPCTREEWEEDNKGYIYEHNKNN